MTSDPLLRHRPISPTIYYLRSAMISNDRNIFGTQIRSLYFCSESFQTLGFSSPITPFLYINQSIQIRILSAINYNRWRKAFALPAIFFTWVKMANLADGSCLVTFGPRVSFNVLSWIDGWCEIFGRPLQRGCFRNTPVKFQ